MKIVQLKSQNVKRLTAVEITPDPSGNLVVLGGKNGAGKSSVLDSIMYALAGANSLPAAPVRKGQSKGVVRLDLGDLTVERVFVAGGSTRLTVRGKDGKAFGSPQAVLDKLCGKVAFDPLAFSRQKPKEQLELLKGLVGLDFSRLDRERARLFEERTLLHRDLKAAEAQLAAVPFDPSAPAVEVSVDELLDARSGLEEEASRQRDKLEELTAAEEAVAEGQAAISLLEQQIFDLKERLKAERVAVADGQQRLDELHAEIAAFPAVDVAVVDEQIRSASAVNQRVESNRRHDELAERVSLLDQSVVWLTARLEQIAREKQAAVEAAALPVPGLGFGDDGITMNGLPFEQASAAESLAVSVAMGLALNPTLRVLLVRDGSLLDDASLALIAGMAAKADAQVWVERVGTGDACAVVIEDGAVLSVPAPGAVLPGGEAGRTSLLEANNRVHDALAGDVVVSEEFVAEPLDCVELEPVTEPMRVTGLPGLNQADLFGQDG
jgi:hypothetical protein